MNSEKMAEKKMKLRDGGETREEEERVVERKDKKEKCLEGLGICFGMRRERLRVAVRMVQRGCETTSMAIELEKVRNKPIRVCFTLFTAYKNIKINKYLKIKL